MRKGFTIVELSVVLVVIGVIVGMTLKAQALVETARLRTDVAKIEKIRSAVAVMMLQFESDLNDFRGNSTGGLYDREILIKKGLLTEADLQGVTPETANVWQFYNCSRGADDNKTHSITGGYDGSNICIRHNKLGPVYYCSVEKFTDDEDQSNGSGRSQHTAPLDDIKAIDCFDAAGIAANIAELLIY